MRTILIPLCLSVFSLSSFAKCTASDSWRGPDKVAHFYGGAAIGAAVTMATDKPVYGFLAGSSVALAKELIDSKGRGNCSFQDFAVTALGAAAGAYGTAWLILPKKDGVFVGYAKSF